MNLTENFFDFSIKNIFFIIKKIIRKYTKIMKFVQAVQYYSGKVTTATILVFFFYFIEKHSSWAMPTSGVEWWVVHSPGTSVFVCRMYSGWQWDGFFFLCRICIRTSLTIKRRPFNSLSHTYAIVINFISDLMYGLAVWATRMHHYKCSSQYTPAAQ